jgi:hypothetical protein
MRQCLGSMNEKLQTFDRVVQREKQPGKDERGASGWRERFSYHTPTGRFKRRDQRWAAGLSETESSGVTAPRLREAPPRRAALSSRATRGPVGIQNTGDQATVPVRRPGRTSSPSSCPIPKNGRGRKPGARRRPAGNQEGAASPRLCGWERGQRERRSQANSAAVRHWETTSR